MIMVEPRGSSIEFGNGRFFYTHVPQTTPSLVDHTHHPPMHGYSVVQRSCLLCVN